MKMEIQVAMEFMHLIINIHLNFLIDMELEVEAERILTTQELRTMEDLEVLTEEVKEVILELKIEEMMGLMPLSMVQVEVVEEKVT
jgi:hypothetical protein